MKIDKENCGKKIWVTSDLHLCHDREFIWGPRGFNSVEEMNRAIVDNWNRVVNPADIVFVLGDLMLMDDEKGMNYLRQLKGNILPIRGNHDSDNRWQEYMKSYNVISRDDNDCVIILKYDKLTFYLSHYPTICDNFNEGKPLSRKVINLCGHRHVTDPWADWDKGLIYHVEVDAHNCTPVALDDIIAEIKAKERG